MEGLRKEIQSLADDALIKRAARELCLSGIILMKHLQANVHLMNTVPDAVGRLMLACARASYEAARGFRTMLDVTDRNRSPRNVKGDLAEFEDDLAEMLRSLENTETP